MSEGPLYEAAKSGNIEEVKRLLASGIEPDAEKDLDGYTPLMAAADNRYTNVVIELLQAKADVDVKSRRDQTPVMAAASRGYTTIVTALLEAKADSNYQDMDGYAPLMGAAWNGNTNIAIALLKAKADVDVKDNFGHTPIYYAKKFNMRGDLASMLAQAKDDYNGFMWAHMTREEKNNTYRREYGRAFALASHVTKLPKRQAMTMSEVQKLPPGYRDLMQFFHHNPGRVTWTGRALLLYFNAGSLDNGETSSETQHGEADAKLESNISSQTFKKCCLIC